MNRLDDKVALITGGARGQGAAEAKLFAEAGATVVITDVLDEEGAATAADVGPTCTYLHQDVTSTDEWTAVVDAIVQEHGRMDVLVNNAGIFRITPLLETTDEAWDTMIAINQTGVFKGMRAVAPVMKRQGGGSIINISSIAGLRGTQACFAYGATKWAVRGMTKSAAQDLAGSGVRVNSVHPGLIETAMMDEFGGDRNELAAQVPIGRLAEADEVAALVRFLASDDSSYCTGHEFVIDGGFIL